MITLIGIVLLVGVVVVMVFTSNARKRIVAGRKDMTDGEMLVLFESLKLPPETILSILRNIGLSYGIPYARLRPSDCFITLLSRVDSWRLDAGAERLEEWLLEQYGVVIPPGLKTFTILDLMKLVEGRTR